MCETSSSRLYQGQNSIEQTAIFELKLVLVMYAHMNEKDKQKEEEKQNNHQEIEGRQR